MTQSEKNKQHCKYMYTRTHILCTWIA